MRRRLILAVLCLAFLPAFGGASEPGAVPASALDWNGEAWSGTVRSSHYFAYTAVDDGILTLTLSPGQGAEVDLTAVHFSGSPAFESRREGAVDEVIAVKVARGDRFLVRVLSPFGRPAAYRLVASLLGASEPRRAALIEAPAATTSGGDAAAAVRIPVGVMVPIEASGPRHFAVRAPQGYLLAIRLVPVSADVDLEVSLRDDPSRARAVSARSGFLSEEVYLVPATNGEALIQVRPADSRPGTGPLQYGLLVQFRQPGVSTLRPASEPLWNRIAIEAFDSGERGHGLPGVATGGGWEPEKTSSRILRLP